MKKTSKSKKNNKAKAKKKARDKAISANWTEPSSYVRDPVSGVEVGVHGDRDDRGTIHALQHRPIERVSLNEANRTRTVTQTVPFVKQLYNNGKINADQYYEASEFKRLYDTARMDPLKAANLESVGSMPPGFRRIDQPLRVAGAKSQLWTLYKVLGGANSRMSQAMDRIVGQEMNVTEASGTRGRARDQWLWCLVSALECLASYRQGNWKRMVA